MITEHDLLMKIAFRGYDRRETDSYISELKESYEQQIMSLRDEIQALQTENDSFRRKITELENSSRAVSEVLVDAVKRAQDIESDCKERAKKTDEHYDELKKEWNERAQLCRTGIAEMKKAVADSYDELIGRIDSLEKWSDAKLSLESVKAIPSDAEKSPSSDNAEQRDGTDTAAEINSDILQRQILESVNLDLSVMCNELGIGKENTAEDSDGKNDATGTRAFDDDTANAEANCKCCDEASVEPVQFVDVCTDEALIRDIKDINSEAANMN